MKKEIEKKRTRTRKEYSVEFKHQVVEDLLKTGDSVTVVAQRYSLGVGTIYRWLSIFGIESPQDLMLKIMAMNPDESKRRIAELEREVALLQAKLRKFEISDKFKEELLEVLSKKHNFEVKKKTDLKP